MPGFSIPTKERIARLHPLSLVLVSIWLVFVIVLVWLLETAVSLGPTNPSPPVALTTYPTLLLTIFAQDHAAITALHLGRVSSSALNSPNTAPRTWRELFWWADRSWQGPIGIFSSMHEAVTRRIRLSVPYYLYASTCLIALATPILWTRAYPIQTVNVIQETVISPGAVSFDAMEMVDAYQQTNVGIGTWLTGLSISEMFNATVYAPQELQSMKEFTDPETFFFSGDVGCTNTTIPGLLVKGGCSPLGNTDGLEMAKLPDSVGPYCRNKGFSEGPYLNTYRVEGKFSLNISLCANRGWTPMMSGETSFSNNTGFIYYSFEEVAGLNSLQSGAGLLSCHSNITTGMAVVAGANRTFSSFHEVVGPTTGRYRQKPAMDPLHAAFWYLGLGNSQISEANKQLSEGVLRSLGFHTLPTSSEQTWFNFVIPSAEEVSKRMWRAVSHVAVGTGTLARDQNITYPATAVTQVAVHVRIKPFAVAAYTFLVLWFLMLALITSVSYRKAYAGQLDSYIAGQLVFGRYDLVSDAYLDGLEMAKDNEKLHKVADWTSI